MSNYISSENKGSDSLTSTVSGQPAGSSSPTDRIEELEQRVEALESIFSDRILDKETAHVRAQERDAREKMAVGETTTVVVEEPPQPNDKQAVTHVDGVVTFIEHARGADTGDTLDIKFTDVQPNYAHAIPVE